MYSKKNCENYLVLSFYTFGKSPFTVKVYRKVYYHYHTAEYSDKNIKYTINELPLRKSVIGGKSLAKL